MTAMEPELFLRPTLTGSRFENHTLPVEVAADFAVYQRMVAELAGILFRQENSDWERLPKGFIKHFSIHLRDVEEGSAKPGLLAMFVAAALAVKGSVESYKPYFEDARDLITECVAGQGTTWPQVVPQEFFRYFEKFGASLAEGEAISFEGLNGKPAVLTKANRKKLAGVASIALKEAPFEISGVVVAIDFPNKWFRLKSDKRYFKIPLPESHHSDIRRCAGNDRHSIKAKGVGEFDPSGELHRIKYAEELNMIVNFQAIERLEFLGSLEQGWYDGGGEPCNNHMIENLKIFFLQFYPDWMPLPAIFPSGDGHLSMEWRTKGDPSLDIDWHNQVAEFHRFVEEKETEQVLQLSPTDDWSELLGILKKNIELTP